MLRSIHSLNSSNKDSLFLSIYKYTLNTTHNTCKTTNSIRFYCSGIQHQHQHHSPSSTTTTTTTKPDDNAKRLNSKTIVIPKKVIVSTKSTHATKQTDDINLTDSKKQSIFSKSKVFKSTTAEATTTPPQQPTIKTIDVNSIESNKNNNNNNDNDKSVKSGIAIDQLRDRVFTKIKQYPTSHSHSHHQNHSHNHSNNTFVSSYYKVNEDQLLQYLDRKKLVYRVSGQQIIIKECPFCPDTKGKIDNLWKLYISRETSAYNCFRCSNKGSWFDFKANLGDISVKPITNTSGSASSSSSNNATSTEEEITTTIADIKRMATYSDQLDNHPDVIKRLTGKEKGERGLSLDVCKFYKIGVTTQSFFVDDQWKEQKCITFPWTTLDKKNNVVTHRCKLRALESKAMQRIEPKGGKWGFFGWHTVPQDAKEIILTEGEYDAMAVYQATGKPTISLPNGANSLPIGLLPMLERFEKIYLWMDDDIPGQEGAQKFADKLGIQRTFIVRTKQGEADGPKDANDALLADKDLNKILESAGNIPHDQICEFEDVRTAIHSELKDPSLVNGIKSKWFPTFNKLLKGHRKGELTIFSGPTGIGKTTLLSQLSLDFSTQGTRTLWGSFEIKVSQLAKRMMGQFAGVNLEQHVSNYQKIADDFSALPMYFMRFFGTTQVDKVLDAMEYAVYVHDVEHIVLDNLQFMLSGVTKGAEKYEIMDDAIDKLRNFATQKNVHITLVIHPRKYDSEETSLKISDIFGTAKATQEADNVIIMQNGKNFKYLDIKKNRFSGHLGIVPLTYNQDCSKFTELDISNIPDQQQTIPTQNNNNTQ